MAERLHDPEDNLRPGLERVLFTTPRDFDFFSEESLTKQIGHPRTAWPVALLKELIDNGLDACEVAGTAPPVIEVALDEDGFSVRDNGPGLPPGTLAGSLDYDVRVSDKTYYVSPTRGRQGNALKCVWAAPSVMDEVGGCVEVSAHGRQANYHQRIRFSLDHVAKKASRLDSPSQPSSIKNGTLVRMRASYPHDADARAFYARSRRLVRCYAAFNPHAHWKLLADGKVYDRPPAHPTWRKWMPHSPTSPHWYSLNQLAALVAALVGEERRGGQRYSVRQFLGQFRGLTHVQKQKSIFEEACLPGANLADLVAGNQVDRKAVVRLLAAMTSATRPLNSGDLGVLGKDYLKDTLVKNFGCLRDSHLRYCKRASVKGAALPFVLEVAYGLKSEKHPEYTEVFGVNWSPALRAPFEELADYLSDNLVQEGDPVALLVHLAIPWSQPTDYGKSRFTLPGPVSRALRECVQHVTQTHRQAKLKSINAKRRDDERRAASLERFRREMDRSRGQEKKRVVKEAAWDLMEEVYRYVSDNGSLPAHARQMMYRARKRIQEETGIAEPWTKSSYFTQTLLPDFLAERADQTRGWDVVYDARGHVWEPHTDKQVGLGTLEVREYVAGWTSDFDESPSSVTLKTALETKGPSNRYRFVLFVEKEGFNPLLRRARVAERYDLGVMSTKGMSVTAARKLAEAYAKEGVTILVLHDFDVSGFSILHTLCHDTRRHRFAVRPKVVDLGLRLQDVTAMGLDPEDVVFPAQLKKDPRERLRRCGATAEECDFLIESDAAPYSGKRVELNAMASRQFIDFLEPKLAEQGVAKVVPDMEVLAKAYRLAYRKAAAQRAIDGVMRRVAEQNVDVPKDLGRRVAKRLEEDATRSWDDAIAKIARESSSKDDRRGGRTRDRGR
jgi:DNA topoisomerase VI subunit B